MLFLEKITQVLHPVNHIHHHGVYQGWMFDITYSTTQE